MPGPAVVTPQLYVALVLVVAAAVALLAVRRTAGRRRGVLLGLVAVVAAALVAVPVVAAERATDRTAVAVQLDAAPYDTTLRAGTVFATRGSQDGATSLPEGGGSVVTALDPATGRRRFQLRTASLAPDGSDDGYVVVADDGSVLLGGGNEFVAYARDGRRLWSVPRTSGDDDLTDGVIAGSVVEREPLAFAGGRAVFDEARAAVRNTTGPRRLVGIDASGAEAWTRPYRGRLPDASGGPFRRRGIDFRVGLPDVAAADVSRARWDGVALVETTAYVTLDGELWPAPSRLRGQRIHSADGALVIAATAAGGSSRCRLVGFRDGVRRWASDECQGPIDALTLSREPVFADGDGIFRRVDPADGSIVRLPVEPGVSTTQLCAGSDARQDAQTAASTTDMLQVDGRDLAVASARTGEPTMTTTVEGDAAFRACLGNGSLAVVTEGTSWNPFVGEAAERLEVFDTATGRKTAATTVGGGVAATWGWTPGRVLVQERGAGRLELLGRSSGR